MTAAAHETIGRIVREIGTEVVFGLMGRANMRMLTVMEDHGVRYVAARHETAAVAMADAYARATGRLGVCSVTLGPGFTHCLTGLVEAARAGTPLLLLAAASPSGSEHSGQYVDQGAVCAALGVAWLNLARASDLREVAKNAVRQGRPIAVMVAPDLEPAVEADVFASACGPPEPAVAGAVGIVADMLADAARPVVLAGRGALDAGPQLVTLADGVGALLATTLPAAGLFAGHPFDLGTIGVHGTPAAAELLAEADVLMAFGTSISRFTTCGGHLFPALKHIVRCDTTAAARVYAPVTETIVGDAAAVARAVGEALPGGGACSAGYRVGGVRARIAAGRGPIEGDLGSPGVFVDPRKALEWLDQRLPEATAIVPEPSHASGYALEHLRPRFARGTVSLFDFQSIGLGLAAAVGVAAAFPEHVTVAVAGDGGVLMALGELETMVRYRLPVLLVVLNDAAYGTEVRELQLRGEPIAAATFPETDFAGTARALGASGATVRDLADLSAVEPWLNDPAGPFVVDCRIDPRHPAAWFTAAIGRPDGFLRAPRPGFDRPPAVGNGGAP